MLHKILVLSLVSLSVHAADITFTDADLKCFDGKTEIAIYNPGLNYVESGEEFSFADAVAQQIVIKIKTGDEVQTFANSTIAVGDGFGNVRYHTFSTDKRAGQNSINVLELMSMDYDHETGFLTGHYGVRVPVHGSEFNDFTYQLIPLPAKSMNCYDYTYGDKL